MLSSSNESFLTCKAWALSFVILAVTGVTTGCGNGVSGTAPQASSQRPRSTASTGNENSVQRVEVTRTDQLAKAAVQKRVDDFFANLIYSLQGETCYAARAFAQDLVGQNDFSRGEVKTVLTEALFSALRITSATGDASRAITPEIRDAILAVDLRSLQEAPGEGDGRAGLLFQQAIRARNLGPRRDLNYKYQVLPRITPEGSSVDFVFDVSNASYDPQVSAITVRFERAENPSEIFKWNVVNLAYPESARRLIERSCDRRPVSNWFQR